MFPSRGGAELSWSEPWLFKLRTSSRTAWIVRGAFFASVYVLFAFLLQQENDAPNGPKFGLAGVLLMPALIGAVFLVMFEFPNAQRIVSVSDKGLSCVGAFMALGGPIHLLTGMRNWNVRELKQVTFLRAGEADNVFPFGLMVVRPKYASAKRIGVPTTVSLNAIADRIHDMGVEVQLSDWRPAAAD